MDKVLRVGYAVYPSVKMRDITPDPSTKSGVKMKFVKELLFGDYIKPYVTDGAYETITVKSGTNKGEYIKVHCRNVDGYIKKSEIQEKRILEVNFIDVGQGDGMIAFSGDICMAIDGGSSFIQGIGTYRIEPAILYYGYDHVQYWFLTHPDTDHVSGIIDILTEKASPLSIEKVVIPTPSYGRAWNRSQTTFPRGAWSP